MSDGGGHDAYGGGPPPSYVLASPGPHAVADGDLRAAAPRGARQLAGWIPDGAGVPWHGLEVAAYARHPEVQDALDPRRRWRRRADALPPGALWAMTLLAVLGAAVTATALGGEAGYGAPSAAAADRWAAVAATLGGLALLARTASWLATRAAGRQPHASDLVVAVVGVATLHGLVSLGWMVSTQRWTTVLVVPVVASLAVAVVAGLLVAMGREPEDVPEAAPRDPRRLAAALPEREQARVRRDLAGALDELERRGLATPATLARARTAELGDLADAALRRGGRRR
ncbi:hypothetical protein [Nocardioides zeae]